MRLLAQDSGKAQVRAKGSPQNAPAQRAASSDSDESDSVLRAPAPRAKALVRVVPLPKPKPKPQARAKQRARPKAKQLPRALDRLALLRRVHQQRRVVQAVERETRRQARVQEILTTVRNTDGQLKTMGRELDETKQLSAKAVTMATTTQDEVRNLSTQS